MMSKFSFKKIFIILLLLGCTGLLILFLMGTYFTGPAQSKIGSSPEELHAENITIENIRGWFSQGTNDKCILLLHGVKANRLSMTKRAIFLHALGYSTLQIDLQAHGESLGEHITFGYEESFGVKKAIQYLRTEKKCSRVGAIGVSLGGASLLLGPEPAKVDVLILESVYPTIEDAVFDRIAARLGNFIAQLSAPLLYQQIPLRLNVQLNQLHPVDVIQNVTSPVFIISGTDDKHTTEAETKLLFAKANTQKKIWLVKGAKHEDLHQYAKKQYEIEIQKFINQNLN